MKPLRFVPLVSLLLLSVKSVFAHCPLCTAGAAAAAGGALWLGVDKVVVGLFLGAFAVSTGWWISRLIKKQYVPFQKHAIIIGSFVLTMLPIVPFITQVYPLYLSWGGDYGSLFNRTYVINVPFWTSMFGGLVVSITPSLSKKISDMRKGKTLPFQGIILTFTLLAAAGITLQLVIS